MDCRKESSGRSSPETEIEFEVVEPGDSGIDPFGLKAVGEALEVGAEALGLGRVVVGDDDGVAMNADVSVPRREALFGEVGGIPLAERLAQSLAELIEGGLGEEGEAHLAVADMEVEGAGALPAQGLVVVKELLDVPAFGEVDDETFDLVASIVGAKEPLEVIVGGPLAAALDPLGQWGSTRAANERTAGGRQTGPLRAEGVGRQALPLATVIGLLRHGDQERPALPGAHLIEQLEGEVFAVGQDQGGAIVGGQDALGQGQQFQGGLGGGATGGPGEQADRLAGVGIQGEEGLGAFAGPAFFFVIGTMATHLSLAVAGNAVGIDRQEAPGEMAPGPAHQAQGDLKFLGLGDGVGVEQIVNGAVGGDVGQAVGQFEAFLAEGATLPDAGDAEGGLVDQLQGQVRSDVPGGLSGPGAHQVPGAEAKMLGHQEPETDEGSGDLTGQELADVALETGGVGWFEPGGRLGTMGLQQKRRGGGTKDVEFFFAGRSGR